ncbi:MAG TPA: MBL fold metallo-hydrolase [candidate division Zixibacteria bacterium]|nr:MBL fold metallo-hydrolase [candidate division Zixibacteria bacterium]
MRRFPILLVTLLIISCSNNAKSPLQLTFVSNCGFILEAGESKIVIDGLLTSKQSIYYAMPSDSVVALIREAAPPFDDLDLILITHVHSDHFDAALTVENMLHNRHAQFVGPPQAEDSLELLPSYEQIDDRVHIVPARADSIIELTFDGILVRALPSKHSASQELDSLTGETYNVHANVDHLEYVIQFEGRTVYHSGDADINDYERYTRYGFGQEPIDLAMVDWWDERPRMTFVQKLIHDLIRPRTVAMMHLAPRRPPKGHPESQTLVADRVLLPEHQLQTWTIE